MNYYISIFPNSRVVSVSRNGPDGAVDFVEFELDGRRFHALNSQAEEGLSGGAEKFKFNEAISFVIDCNDQKEVDHYWNKLIDDGGKEFVCGWCHDKYGVSWQVVPRQLPEMVRACGSDKIRFKRVHDALLRMNKIQVAELQAAYDGVSPA
jgi:predicted 3-demethylubiquinone-9 3-methyltransferase (glyoxalase superfamily)